MAFYKKTSIQLIVLSQSKQKLMINQFKPNPQEVQALRKRMRNGTGASRLLSAQDCPTHYLDSLQRFKKDFATHQKDQRQTDKLKRQRDLQRKRLEQMERQNNRWEMVENYQEKLKNRQQTQGQMQRNGEKKGANSTSLAYNPINLSYNVNPQGQRLKRYDQDTDIRRFVRAKNMQDRGNSKYNPINGQGRVGIQAVVPEQLSERYMYKLKNHYEQSRLKAPSLDMSNASNQNSRYY